MQIVKGKRLAAIILITVTIGISLFVGYAQKIETSVELVSAVCPVYPPIAQAAQVSGDVRIKVTINEQGNVSINNVVDGHPLLKDAAKQAAALWQFNTDTTRRSATLTFTFQMMPRCSPRQKQTSIFYPPLRVEVRAEKPPITCDDCPPSEQEKLRCKNP